MLNLSEIKTLQVSDFELQNDRVWTSIKNLSLSELEELAEAFIWADDEIQNGLNSLLQEKKEKTLVELLKEKLSFDDLRLMREVLLLDRDITWSFLRML